MTTYLYIMACRALPKEYVDIQTQMMEYENPNKLIAVNPRLEPIQFYSKSGSWEKIQLTFDNFLGDLKK